MEDVDKFKCLDSMFVANGQGTEEIRSRINIARFAFFSPEMLSLVAALRPKVRVNQAAVLSNLLYGCET